MIQLNRWSIDGKMFWKDKSDFLNKWGSYICLSIIREKSHQKNIYMHTQSLYKWYHHYIDKLLRTYLQKLISVIDTTISIERLVFHINCHINSEQNTNSYHDFNYGSSKFLSCMCHWGLAYNASNKQCGN